MRSFDPRAVGRLECWAWESYYRRRWAPSLAASVGMVRASTPSCAAASGRLSIRPGQPSSRSSGGACTTRPSTGTAAAGRRRSSTRCATCTPRPSASPPRWRAEAMRPLFGGPGFLVGVRRLLPCGLAVALLAVLPCATAAAERRAQPLVDLPPAPGARVVDRVLDGTPPALRARAAQASGHTTVVRAADGQPVRVTLTNAYAADPAIARSYVTFLSD